MRKFNLTILFLLALLPVLFAGQTTRIPYQGVSTPTIRTALPEYIIRKEVSAWK